MFYSFLWFMLQKSIPVFKKKSLQWLLWSLDLNLSPETAPGTPLNLIISGRHQGLTDDFHVFLVTFGYFQTLSESWLVTVCIWRHLGLILVTLVQSILTSYWSPLSAQTPPTQCPVLCQSNRDSVCLSCSVLSMLHVWGLSANIMRPLAAILEVVNLG